MSQLHMRGLPITKKALLKMLKTELTFSTVKYEKECLMAFCPPIDLVSISRAFNSYIILQKYYNVTKVLKF